MHIEDLNRSQNAEWQMNEIPSKCIKFFLQKRGTCTDSTALIRIYT